MGDWALCGLVISLTDSVNDFTSSDISNLGDPDGMSANLGSLDVSICRPQVSRSVAMNSCLKSGWAVPVRMVIWFCFFSVATLNACRMSLFCLIACPDSNC